MRQQSWPAKLELHLHTKEVSISNHDQMKQRPNNSHRQKSNTTYTAVHKLCRRLPFPLRKEALIRKTPQSICRFAQRETYHTLSGLL